MTTYAFTFGQPYDLADAICLVEADSAEEATAEFVAARREVDGGLDNPEFRWSTMAPYEGSVRALFDYQEYRVVPIDTPIHYKDRSPSDTNRKLLSKWMYKDRN